MKYLSYGRFLLELLLMALVAYFGIKAYDAAELEVKLKELTDNQVLLQYEKDSIIRLLEDKSLQYDTVFSNYKNLSDELHNLAEQNYSLIKRYNQRGRQLKKVNSEFEELSRKFTAMSSENDSLRNALRLLFEKFALCEDLKYQSDSLSNELAQTLKEKEEKILADSLAEANKPNPAKESGFLGIAEIGGGFGLGDKSVDYSKSLLSVDIVTAYRINSHFISGFGTGLSLYNGGPMIPLYLDFRYILKERKFTPFIVADGGFLFVLKDFPASGIFINPAVGATRKLSDKLSLHLSSGMLLQSAPAGPPYGGFRKSFINFKAGISFMGK